MKLLHNALFSKIEYLFRDGRLLPGDFILEINEHWLKGVASDQVATVLRGCGLHVRLVVARPVEPTELASIPGWLLFNVSKQFT